MSDPILGATQTTFSRVAASAYDDGIADPAVGTRQNARVISNKLCVAADGEQPNPYDLSDYVWQWGQFLDHDITLSFTSAEAFYIEVGAGDPMQGIIPLTRTIFHPDTGTSSPREQINSVTSFIDASMVYGSDGVRAAALRTFSGGRLNTSAGDLMPMNTNGLPNANDLGLPTDDLFLGGDVRSNEQLALTCMHTVFMREHNRLAQIIADENPSWDDRQIYQRTRKIVGAYVQAITYNEFLPAMLGPMAPDPSTFSYDPTRDPGITNEFATATYRVGHTMVSDQLLMMQDDGQPAPVPSIGVFDAFFAPSTLINDPQKIDWILMGLSEQAQRQVDTKVVDSLRNQLFGPAGAGGVDLAAINIQRGRDHGLASYNDTRAAYGLPRMASFDEVTSNPAKRSALADSYTDVEEIDLWIGGLAEEHMPNVPMGELMAVSMREQFTDLAEGDRFFYLFDPELADVLDTIDTTTLSDIIMRNSGLTTMRADVFHVAAEVAQLATSEPDHLAGQLTISLSGNDVLVGMGGAAAAASYELQRSTDGRDWEAITTAVPDAQGQVTITDPGAGLAFTRAFYRIEKK